MRDNEDRPSPEGHGQRPDEAAVPVLVATIFREDGGTGVHTHFRQLRRYLNEYGIPNTLVTPFSWERALTYPVFAPRLVLRRVSGPASVVWYRYWHEVFLRNALRRQLAEIGACVVYAQGPLEARAALRARQGPHQRVVLAVHFRVSQADEHAESGREIRPDSSVFRAIRQLERDVIPQVNGIVYVSQWARDALLSWLPEAAQVPSAVIGNFVAPIHYEPGHEPLADLVSIGKLEIRKNHRFLLEVLAAAKRAGRSYTLDVFGEGELEKDLLQLTRSLDLERQVRFRGFCSGVRDFLPGYRAYAHAARGETSSLAIIEAMGAGLPILAGNIGPIGELCDDGAEARFWDLDDPCAAAATMMTLLDSEPTRLMAARAASLRFRRDFDANVIGPRLHAFLLGMTPHMAGETPS
jgi:glycosyltransferase involved in cell wall biosynthesis